MRNWSLPRPWVRNMWAVRMSLIFIPLFLYFESSHRRRFSTVVLYSDTIPSTFLQSFAAMLNSITCSQFLSFITKGKEMRLSLTYARFPPLSHDRSSLLRDRISKEIIEVLFWNWVNKLTNFSLSSCKVGVLKITQRLWWGTVIYW